MNNSIYNVKDCRQQCVFTNVTNVNKKSKIMRSKHSHDVNICWMQIDFLMDPMLNIILKTMRFKQPHGMRTLPICFQKIKR